MSAEDDDPPPFLFETEARSFRTAAVVVLVYTALIALWIALDAALIVLGVCALATLPALWDLWRNPRSGLALDDRGIRWWSGRANGHIEPSEIDRVRIDTSWDFSKRVSVMLTSGRRVRLPYECSPPDLAFEAALTDRGIPVVRHHFSLRS